MANWYFKRLHGEQMVELYNFLTLDQVQVIIINFWRAAGRSQAFTNDIAGLPLLNRCSFLDFFKGLL